MITKQFRFIAKKKKIGKYITKEENENDLFSRPKN